MFPSHEGELLLGCAGRLSVEKGHHLLLEMMQQLKEQKIHCRLLLAGEGKLDGFLKKRAEELGVDHMVEFLGFVEDMPAFYSSLDIFLLPSAFEGFGYVLIEAMASRKPVVVFNVGSSMEILEHGRTGYLVPPNQVQEMAGRVIELAEDRELREKFGENGRSRVEELFSFEKNKMEIIELLKPSF
jgi:glycosyltransferase involved in cell wall biosynthesis